MRLLLLRREGICGRPTLLLRKPQPSQLGNFSYQPALLQPGRHGTREHRLTLALRGWLLEPVQGPWPARAGCSIPADSANG